MGKPPSIQFYTGDWLKDPSVARCSLAARGAWIDMLCAMHEDGRSGKLIGTTMEMARICRCLPDEIDVAIHEIARCGVADVTERNGEITIINRRMLRESHERKLNADRQKRHRESNVTPESRKNNAPVTEKSHPPSSSSSSSSKKDIRGESKSKKKKEYTTLFLKAWSIYPKKPNNPKKAAFKAWEARVNEGVTEADLVTATENYISWFNKSYDEIRFLKLAMTFYGPGGHIEGFVNGEPEPLRSKKKGGDGRIDYTDEEYDDLPEGFR